MATTQVSGSVDPGRAGVTTKIEQLLGDKASYLLEFKSPKISKDRLHLPGPDFVDRVWAASDRNVRVLANLQRLFSGGRLRGTGYLSILPVDQGIEHSGGASFAKNPDYFDGENIVKLAIEGGCNAVASTFGVLGSVARKYAHKIPFILKINHNELLTYPNKFDQILFGTVKEAYDLGAAAVGATIYFGSDQSARQIIEISQAFAQAHELGIDAQAVHSVATLCFYARAWLREEVPGRLGHRGAVRREQDDGWRTDQRGGLSPSSPCWVQ